MKRFVKIKTPVNAVRFALGDNNPEIREGSYRWAGSDDSELCIEASPEATEAGKRGRVQYGTLVETGQTIEQGDYLITHNDGWKEVVKSDEFKRCYRAVTKEEAAAAPVAVAPIVMLRDEPETMAAHGAGETGTQPAKKPAATSPPSPRK